MKLTDSLKGITGNYEINRVVGAVGAVAYILCSNLFVAWDILIRHHEFDLVAYCTAFPGGLAITVTAIAGAVSLKDRNTATAQVVRDTGAMPTPAGPAGTADDPTIVAGAPVGSPPVQTKVAKP